MAWESAKNGIKYKAVGVSPEFHAAVRQLAAADKKGRKMYEILDQVILPILKKKLAKLQAVVKIIVILFASLLLGSCQRYELGSELTEQGQVEDLCFVPRGHGTGFSTSGHTSWVDIPARYAVVFRCPHGNFVIDDERAEEIFKRLHKGDNVTITYQEKFLNNGEPDKRVIGLHFVNATKN